MKCGSALADTCAPRNTSLYQSPGRGHCAGESPVPHDRAVALRPRGVLVRNIAAIPSCAEGILHKERFVGKGQ
jgi:hypothetical protein